MASPISPHSPSSDAPGALWRAGAGAAEHGRSYNGFIPQQAIQWDMWVKRLTLVLLIVAPGYFHFAAARAEEAVDPNAAILSRLDNIERLLTNRGLLEMLQQIERLQEEINRLLGEIEAQNHALEQIKKRQRDLYTDIDQRLQQLEGAPPVAAQTIRPGAATDMTNPPLETLSPIIEPVGTDENVPADTPLTLEIVKQDQPAPATPPTPGADDDATAMVEPEPGEDDITNTLMEPDPIQARADYVQAFKLLKQSLYKQSVRAFREFLRRYPDSEDADNAQFWLGEAYYVNSLFNQALIEYSALLQNYPDSQKRSQAQLKLAYSLHRLGQIEPAKKQLEELIQRYPGTTAARLAQDRLKKIAAIATPTDITPTDQP